MGREESEIKPYKLVYAIYVHPNLGNLIEAYAVKLNIDESFAVKNTKVHSQNLNDKLYQVTAIDREIINLIDNNSEENIVKKYSKKNERFSDFIAEFDIIVIPAKIHKTKIPYVISFYS